MGVLKEPVAFVDVETTGKTYRDGRITEVAIIRLDPSGEVTKYQTLVNPNERLSRGITELTGITNQVLAGAPRFDEVAREIYNLLDGCVLVAHVVRFDYTFLKTELSRVGLTYRPKMLCTVRLSRRLYPSERAHNLDSIIARLGLKVENRHRAMADTEVLWEFYKHIHERFSLAELAEVVKGQLRLQALPAHVDSKVIDKLPESPGVYIFEGDGGTPLYIGKAVNIRDRVLSHFNSDHLYSKELKLSAQIKHIDYVQTHGELSALLLESELVKERQPLYNQKLRKSEDMTPILRRTNDDGYFTAEISKYKQIDPNQIGDVVGVFRSNGQARRSLESICDQFGLCSKLVDLERTKTTCFRYQLKKCQGACCGEEPVDRYNSRFDQAFAYQRVKQWPFAGPIVVSETHPEMDGASGFVFDNWCLLGKLRDFQGEVEFSARDQVFDTDMYSIVKRYIANPVHRSKIKVLTANPEVIFV